MRLLLLIFTLFLASCGANSNTGTSTDVTISLGQSVASGAIGATGSIPASVQSVSVEALNASGKVIAGPIIANRPNFTVRIRVPNGNGIRFRILAFDTKDAKGKTLYETLSAPVDLKGKPVAVPVKMSLSVAVTSDKTIVFRNGFVNFNGFVSGNVPQASSPLIWAKTGGSFDIIGTNGATATWIAPNTPNTYTIAARIDPAVNPDQDPTVKDSVQVEVVNRKPRVTSFNTTPISVVAGTQTTLTITNFATVVDDDGDTLTISTKNKPSWVLINPSTPTASPLTINIDVNSSSVAAGNYTFTLGVSDGFGGMIARSINITVTGAPVAPTPTITSPTSGAIVTANFFISGNVAVSSLPPSASGIPIDIYIDASFAGTNFAISDGATAYFSFSPTGLTSGSHTAIAYSRINGVRSAPSNTVTFTYTTPAPNITTNNVLSLASASVTPAVIDQLLLETTDADTPPAGLIYTITSTPTQGTLSTTAGGTLPINGQVSQDVMNQGNFKYTPAASANGRDSFTFTVTDGITTRNGVFLISYNFGAAKTTISALNGNNIITSGATCNTVWDAYGSPYVVQDNITIQTGCNLFIKAGVIIKAAASSLTVNYGGTLDIYGTAAQPVTFTSIHDDSVGGDSNANGGATTPAISQGVSLTYNTGSLGSMSFFNMKYSDGFSIKSAIPMNDVSRFDGGFGMSFSGAMNQTVSNLHIEHNGIGGDTALYMSGTGTNPVFTGVNTVDKYGGVHETVVISSGANPNFQNFTIDNHGSNQPALAIYNAGTNPLIQNNTIQNATNSDSVRIGSGASPILANNIIRNSKTGVYMSIWFNPIVGKAGDVTLRNNKIVNNQTGIYIKNTTSAIVTNNLIRGNSSEGVRVGTLNQTLDAIQIRNNLIGENGTGIHVVGNTNPTTDTYATIESNTIGASTGTAGVLFDKYTNINLNYNILSGNPTDVLTQSIALASSYNLTTDASLPTGGLSTNIYADPQFTSGFYISDGTGLNGNNTVATSPAIDPLGLTVLASSQPLDFYAQPNIIDSGILDLGYHHANPAPIISPTTSVVTSSVLPGGVSQIDIKILIIPKDNIGSIIGAGLDVQVSMPAQGFISQVSDLGDGGYELLYSTPIPSPGSVSLGISANGVSIPNTITW